MSKKVTIVIPCFNQGHFLQDALKSVEACDRSLYDLIIVNDGSTDENSIKILKQLTENGYHVIFQQNKGLGEARNTGVRLANTPYVLPLDADNKIHAAYLTKAIEIMDAQPNIAVVYANANLFGDNTGVLKQGSYNLQKMMLCNIIDACAVIRTSVLKDVGLYDNMKIMGLEDWDLWLRIGFAGHGFYYLDEILFDYRIRHDSMLRNLNANIQKQNNIEDYLSSKFADKLDFDFVFNLIIYKIKTQPVRIAKYLLLKKFFPRYFQKQIDENKMLKNFVI